LLSTRRIATGSAVGASLLALISVLAVVAGACGTPPAATGEASEMLQAAVENTRSAHSFRVRGRLGAGATALRWEGIVVRGDEQYRMAAMGTTLDVRRIDGVAWARPIDGSRPWNGVPSDGSFDVGVLLHGDLTVARTIGDHRLVQIRFEGEDVLRSLSHIPSTGPTQASVMIRSGFVAETELRLQDGASARVELWDFGAPLVVEPVDVSS
jgi:hypothetical protein